MKSFFRKNDFSKNIFWRLACTKKSPTAKKEIWQHPVAVAGFQPNLQTFGLIRQESGQIGHTLAISNQNMA
jgi:hypothetical protein